MSASDGENAHRLQEVLAALLARRLELSLAQVEQALQAWRAGGEDAAFAHAETLRHVQRASALGSRVARAGLEGPITLLRDALELGVIDAAEFEKLTGKTADDVPPAPSLDEESAKNDVAAMPAKRDVVIKLLEDGPVLIHVDARQQGIEVPEGHRREPKLVLRLGYGLTPPIPDLAFDEKGVRATLTFRGKPFTCRIPWPAIYAVVAEDGRGLVWPEHVPPEVADEFTRKEGPTPPREPPDPDKPKGRGHLRLV